MSTNIQCYGGVRSMLLWTVILQWVNHHTLSALAQCNFAPQTNLELRHAIVAYLHGNETYGPIGEWCVDNVTDFSNLFVQREKFNEDISGWRTSQVTDMKYMFSEATIFNQPLESWDVSSVTNMERMFSEAHSFNQPLNSWNVSSVLKLNGTFSEASSFNQPLDLWDISSAKVIYLMFEKASSFNQPLELWDVSSANVDLSFPNIRDSIRDATSSDTHVIGHRTLCDHD